MSNTTTKIKQTNTLNNTTASTIQDDELVWVKFDDNNFWFTKQEILLGFIIFIIALVSIFLIYRNLLYRKFNKQSSTQKKVNRKSKKIYIGIAILIIIFITLHMATGNATILFFSIFITAISYNFIPCILKFIMKKEYDKTQAKRIAIINTIIVYVLFRILELEMYGTMDFHNYAYIIWGYVSYCILSYSKKDSKELNLLVEDTTQDINKVKNEK